MEIIYAGNDLIVLFAAREHASVLSYIYLILISLLCYIGTHHGTLMNIDTFNK